MLGGDTVRSLVPVQLADLVGDGFEMTLHPMDLSLVGRKKTLSHARAAIVRELTFTEAYQTWSKEAQAVEDRLIKAARGEDDLDAIGTELNERDFDFEEWEILYRLLLQVRLRVSATETDALDSADEPKPALRERVAAAAPLTPLALVGGTLIDGYRKGDPKTARAALDQKIAEAQGGPDKPAWFTFDKSQIPTLAASTQNISKLQGEIAQKQGTTAIRRSPHGSKSRSSRPPAMRAPDSRRAVSPQCQARTRAGGEPFVRTSY